MLNNHILSHILYLVFIIHKELLTLASNNIFMKHILVPIGSSENSKNTLQYAIDFAKVIDAKIFVFRAYNVLSKAGTIINLNEIIQRETKLYIRSIINSVNNKDVDIKIISSKGNPTDSIKAIDKELGIDLIVLGPKSNSIKEDVFLGNTSGSIIKQTEIPTLVVPENYKFSPISNILLAFKSGIVTKKGVLEPLKTFTRFFNSKIDLLLVKTPEHTEKDSIIDDEINQIKSTFASFSNETTFKGVLEYLETNNPDMLCVFRRKRGFFKKLWEKNHILKKEFHCNVPLLVLSGKK